MRLWKLALQKILGHPPCQQLAARFRSQVTDPIRLHASDSTQLIDFPTKGHHVTRSVFPLRVKFCPSPSHCKSALAWSHLSTAPQHSRFNLGERRCVTVKWVCICCPWPNLFHSRVGTMTYSRYISEHKRLYSVFHCTAFRLLPKSPHRICTAVTFLT